MERGRTEMKAAVIREFGDIEVLKYEEIATPKPKEEMCCGPKGQEVLRD